MAVELQSVESSMVDSIGYDEEAEELVVEYLSGKTHSYPAPPGALEEALEARSLGGFLYKNVIEPHMSGRQAKWGLGF